MKVSSHEVAIEVRIEADLEVKFKVVVILEDVAHVVVSLVVVEVAVI